MTQPAPRAPSGPSFALRVAELERELPFYAGSGTLLETVRLLIPCIREQQAALAGVAKMDDEDTGHIEGIYEETMDAVRATLAKYALEVKP